jgi:alpha-tubulin suppressor-like RCC1 family protein
MWSWGRNNVAQLGLNDTYTNRSSPVQIGALTTWANVAAGGQFAVAIKTDGTLWAWGFNGAGQLGIGDATARSSPVQVGALTAWVNIAVGNSFTIALKAP